MAKGGGGGKRRVDHKLYIGSAYHPVVAVVFGEDAHDLADRLDRDLGLVVGLRVPGD